MCNCALGNESHHLVRCLNLGTRDFMSSYISFWAYFQKCTSNFFYITVWQQPRVLVDLGPHCLAGEHGVLPGPRRSGCVSRDENSWNPSFSFHPSYSFHAAPPHVFVRVGWELVRERVIEWVSERAKGRINSSMCLWLCLPLRWNVFELTVSQTVTP